MVRELAAAAFLVVGCSLTSLDSLDDNAGTTPDSGAVGATGGGSNACVPSCERAMQAGCPQFTQAQCLTDCQAKGASLASECVGAYGALLLCAGESGSYICDGNGKASLVTCTDETTALATCAGQSGGGTGGTSGTGGTGGTNPDSGACDPGPYYNVTCTELASQTADCDDCIVTHCCEFFDACFADPECAGLYTCAANCSATPDFSKCVTDTCSACTVAVDGYNAMSQCVVDHCSNQCMGA